MKKSDSKFNTGWLTTYLLQRGISSDAIIAGGNLPVDTNLATLKRLPFINYLKLFNWAADYLNNDNLGLYLVNTIEPEDLLPVGLGSYKFCNLRELLQALHQFNRLITQGIDITYKETEITSILTYRVILPTGEDTRQDTELTFAMLIRVLRRVLGDNWYPLQVNFSHAAPKDTCKHSDVLGDHVCFNKSQNNITFDMDDLDTLMPDADPVLRKRFRKKLQHLLEESLQDDDFLSKVRYYTTISFGSENCGADFVAKRMNISRRSLTRNLRDLGTNFRNIKEDIKIEVAKSTLAESRSNINAIALELGFSDVSAFARSFKNSIGLTPTQYREQIHNEPD